MSWTRNWLLFLLMAMTPEQWQLVDALFHSALAFEPGQRATFLAQACAGDESLLREVQSLISFHDDSASFIETPASDIAAELLGKKQHELEVGQQIAHYKVLTSLGAGGMGEVYLAEDTRLGRRIALKLLPAQFTADAERVSRFDLEARAASALNHPNIVTVHEVGHSNSLHFIATEYIDGETLRGHTMGRTLKLDEVLDIGTQIASALVAAHSAGIMHRDVKPENIMLRRDGIVKVLDFGLAKLASHQVTDVDTQKTTMVNTNPRMVLGTVNYMSPEQAQGHIVDARTDIWSLGVVLYEMATGRVPFEGETPSHVIVSVLESEPPPLTSYSEMPVELQRIVGKALRKNREERYQSASDLAADLKSLKQEMEIEALLKRSLGADTDSGKMTRSGGQAGATVQESATRTADVATARTVSSAEYLIGEIKRRKLGVALAAAAVLVTVAALTYNFYPASGGEAIDSIAVLPFVNAGGDPNTEYLSDGISDSVINSLSQLPQLKVMSRNSVFRYKGQENDAQEVGQKLGVRAVLTGRVALRGETLAISTELVDARDNSQIWGQQYNRRLADVFAVQEEIAKEISEKLRLKLTGAERQQLAKRPTENLKAFQYYMQGRAYTQRRTREDLLTAVRYCERAIEEDRNYALAYAGLADAYAVLGSRGYIAPVEGRRQAEEAARKALALDENLAEAHVAFGQTYFQFVPYNFSLSDRALRRAIELSPSFALAHLYLGVSLVEQGRLDEGLEELLKARELDPLSSIIARQSAIPYYLKRDYTRALELLRQANELGPVFTSTWEIGAYIQNRLFDEALAELEKAKRERKSDPILIYGTGMVYAAQGKRAEALQIIKELEEMSDASLSQAHWIAKIYAALNENEMAFSWLERGLAAGAIGYFYKDEPVWDTIRSDPRFDGLLQRMGITQ